MPQRLTNAESPTTNVDEGCSKSERDTDQDGVNDLLDNCPEQPKGPDGFDDGCPLPKSETDDGGTTILGMTVPVFGGVLTGGIVTLFLLAILIGRLRNRGYDYDDDDDFFDDDEDDFLFIPKQTDTKPLCTPNLGLLVDLLVVQDLPVDRLAPSVVLLVHQVRLVQSVVLLVVLQALLLDPLMRSTW